MIETVVGLIRFGFSLLFGVAVSLLFAGIGRSRRNNIVIICACVTLLLAQFLCWLFFGIEKTSKLYPLIIHVPMLLLFTLYFKRPWLTSFASVLSAYLCCQAPRWVGLLVGAAVNSSLGEHIFYIVAVALAYYFLKRYVAGSVQKLMENSVKSRMLLGAVPFFYYIFDYYTTIYTDILYTGTKWAVQFMPSTISVFYFVFVIIYYAETQKQASAQRERDMLATQLQVAKTEFSTLRELQECTALYRHDMRHHISFLKGLAAEGNTEKIKEYLNAAERDMDDITPVRFCENETVNLILSSFAVKAKQAGVSMTIDAKLPAEVPVSDTELCSLLSNGLENAITAAANCPSSPYREILVKIKVHKGKLLISIDNPYMGEVKMKDGHPQSSREGHGFGTRSIAAIADNYGGLAIFGTENGIFTLKVMLPFGE